MAEKRTIIHKPGELFDYETVFVENPDLKGEPKRRGHMERVEYTTDVYGDGKTYQKYCNVYLPWCYNPRDKFTAYNVLYYQHGNTCDPEIFNTEETVKMFDMLFDSGEIDPCIIVSTTYYFDVTKDVEERRKTGYVPAGDGNYEGIPGNFYREIVENIIPAVERRYNTYLMSTTPEAIKATRDHRAFSGYSRGSVMTWKTFHYDFEYFRWFAPMSCHTTADHSIREQITKEDVLAYLEEPIKKHPNLPFFIFASNGGEKDVAAMREQMKYIPFGEGFSYGPDPKKNNIYFSVSEFPHTDLLVHYYCNNSLKVLFRA